MEAQDGIRSVIHYDDRRTQMDDSVTRAACSCLGGRPGIRASRAGHAVGMTERSKDSGLSVGEVARAVPEDLGRVLEGADERLRETMHRKPLLDNLVDWRLVLLAGAAGLVLGGIARLVVSWIAAVAIFLLVFVTVMLVIAGRRTGD